MVIGHGVSMIRKIMRPTVMAVLALFAAVVLQAADTDFVPLFNGRNLDGWQVDTPGIWSVQDGMIVGKHEGLAYNDFLRTAAKYCDFILVLKFRLVDARGNSGVQFRSKPVPNSHEVSGYQADIRQQYWGCLYDKSRRDRILVQAPAAALTKLDKTGWNEYVIRAEGNHITHELNGSRTADYTEHRSLRLHRAAGPQLEGADRSSVQGHPNQGAQLKFNDAQQTTINRRYFVLRGNVFHKQIPGNRPSSTMDCNMPKTSELTWGS